MTEIQRAHLANNIMLFFASLAAAGLLFAVLNDPFTSLMAAGEGQTAQAQQAEAYVEQFWSALPFIMVFLGLVQLLGAATVEARTP